ncbi:MAG TPA: flavodoxin-dependent (E)-4-hydroxy-3-methylbut-2-enyl-diphosphate synthase, partial [Candidatus Nanoarchaeia archaeon]|nr:flavodoxin-dependent (E)-4-hydroxy-3-methylbut-2-enyl-diphosphate synthase [Candidatus Nanoarchaeia archaeon]
MTKEIKIGNVKIGNANPVAIQSMTNTLTTDVSGTISQIQRLIDEGCEIIRVSVPDDQSAEALKEISENISIPLVADIHFDHRLAIKSAKYVDKLRINPGNIGKDKIKEVIAAAKEYSIPIRVGVNMGSLEKDIEQKYGFSAQAMVE